MQYHWSSLGINLSTTYLELLAEIQFHLNVMNIWCVYYNQFIATDKQFRWSSLRINFLTTSHFNCIEVVNRFLRGCLQINYPHFIQPWSTKSLVLLCPQISWIIIEDTLTSPWIVCIIMFQLTATNRQAILLELTGDQSLNHLSF